MKSFLASALLLLALSSVGCAENPAEKVPVATVNTSAEATATPGATPEESGTVFRFGEGTEIGFVGSKVTGSHVGGFKKVDGTVIVPGDNLERARIAIEIDVDSIFTDTEKLTLHLKSPDFFDVESYPTAAFKSTSVKKSDDGYAVTGDLTMHGVTKSISFPAIIALEGDELATQAEFSINRKDFGIRYEGKPDDLIRDEVVIKFDVKAAKEA